MEAIIPVEKSGGGKGVVLKAPHRTMGFRFTIKKAEVFIT
jgi:hypothetical protein